MQTSLRNPLLAYSLPWFLGLKSARKKQENRWDCAKTHCCHQAQCLSNTWSLLTGQLEELKSILSNYHLYVFFPPAPPPPPIPPFLPLFICFSSPAYNLIYLPLVLIFWEVVPSSLCWKWDLDKDRQTASFAMAPAVQLTWVVSAASLWTFKLYTTQKADQCNSVDNKLGLTASITRSWSPHVNVFKVKVT